MSEIDRRTLLKVACVLPFAGSLPLFAREPLREELVIHYLFCKPTVGGYWLDFEDWRPWKGDPPRKAEGFARRGKVFLKEEFAGYWATEKSHGMMGVLEPVWGEVIFEERWWKGGCDFKCQHADCPCHQYTRPTPFDGYPNHEERIISYTWKTVHAPVIGWEKFGQVGYHNLWPIEFRKCQNCDVPASSFGHNSDKRTGFYCNECNKKYMEAKYGNG